MEQSTYLKTITNYYKGLREQVSKGVNTDVAYSYAVDLVESLSDEDELIPLFGASALDAALTLPDEERAAVDHLAFMPIEHIGPLLEETQASANDIRVWHGKSLLNVSRVTLAYLETSICRDKHISTVSEVETGMESTRLRMRAFGAKVLALPDFSQDKYVYNVQRSRSVDLALVRSLMWSNLIDPRQCQKHIEAYDRALGLHTDSFDHATYVQRDDPKG